MGNDTIKILSNVYIKADGKLYQGTHPKPIIGVAKIADTRHPLGGTVEVFAWKYE